MATEQTTQGNHPDVVEGPTVQYQKGLDMVGVGAAGQVYSIDDSIVLKTCRIYVRPPDNATPRYLRDFASETIFHHGTLKDEKDVCRLLTEHPHPNIIEAIDTNHPEGIYFRRYTKLPEHTLPCQSDRIFLYQDIMRALRHIHGLGIAHSDIRKDNILSDQQGHAFLADFSASCPFGSPNASLSFLLNGQSETTSSAADMFAMGSLIFEMETGSRPALSVDENNGLVLPPVSTGHAGIDLMIENAWRGAFDSTAAMLEHAERLVDREDPRGPVEYSVPKSELEARIRRWREDREKEHGCVLYAFPTQNQLETLARRWGWGVDDERHFRDAGFTVC